MKWFCNCNSKWEFPGSGQKFKYQSCEYTEEQKIQVRNKGLCPVCYMFSWYEPHYENMMYDLRNMNIIW